MHTPTETSGPDAISAIIAGTTALSRRPGHNSEQQQARADATSAAIRQFEPQNVIEAMLAGLSVMFDRLLNDAVDRMLATASPESDQGKVPAGLVALNNAFHPNLDRFERSRKRADAIAKAPARTTVTRSVPPTPPVKMTPPETPATLPGLPARLAPGQQLQAAVDALGSRPRTVRPSDAILSGIMA